MVDNDDLRRFHQHLVRSKNILVLIGSGLSAASGIETFQKSSGNWRGFDSIDVSTPDAFLDNPGLVWQFYSSRRRKALKAKPNKGHYAIAELSRRLNHDPTGQKHCLTINQNMDGLNIRAGQEPLTLLEFHGSLFDLKCTDFFCNYREHNNFQHPLTPALGDSSSDAESVQLADSSDADCDADSDARRKKRQKVTRPHAQIRLDLQPLELPKCPNCGGLLRPGVVWFGESIPLKIIDRIDDFIMNHKVDLVLVIGTSGKIWPAVGYVERVKLQGGKIAIFNKDINCEEIQRDRDNCWGFEGDASETLPVALEPLIGRNYRPRNHRRR